MDKQTNQQTASAAWGLRQPLTFFRLFPINVTLPPYFSFICHVAHPLFIYSCVLSATVQEKQASFVFVFVVVVVVVVVITVHDVVDGWNG